MENFNALHSHSSFSLSNGSNLSLSSTSTCSDLDQSLSSQPLKLNQIAGDINTEDIYTNFGALGLMIWSSVEYLPKFQHISLPEELLLGLIEYWIQGINSFSDSYHFLCVLCSRLPSKETLVSYMNVENSMEASLFMVILGILQEYYFRTSAKCKQKEIKDVMDEFLDKTQNWIIIDAAQILGLSSF